jgi:hypothetical protein
LPELDQIDEKSIHALESGKPDNYPSPLVPFDTWS